MKSHMHCVVLEILKQHRKKFMMTSDIINEVLRSEEVRHVVHELKHRGHIYEMKVNATDEEINLFVNNSYRREVVLALYILKQKGCLEETGKGRKDSYQNDILELYSKIPKGELGYRITELGISRIQAINGGN